MNSDMTPAQNARHMMSVTDHEPRMNKLIRGLLWVGSRLDALVSYAALLPVAGVWLALLRGLRDLLDMFAAMTTPPTQSA